jgi:hypothetical protein
MEIKRVSEGCNPDYWTVVSLSDPKHRGDFDHLYEAVNKFGALEIHYDELPDLKEDFEETMCPAHHPEITYGVKCSFFEEVEANDDGEPEGFFVVSAYYDEPHSICGFNGPNVTICTAERLPEVIEDYWFAFIDAICDVGMRPLKADSTRDIRAYVIDQYGLAKEVN